MEEEFVLSRDVQHLQMRGSPPSMHTGAAGQTLVEVDQHKTLPTFACWTFQTEISIEIPCTLRQIYLWYTLN